MNNGVERQNRALKHEYLTSYRDRTLSGLVALLVEKFHHDDYRKYVAHEFLVFITRHYTDARY